MESTVEQRLTFLEARVKTLERLLDAGGVSVPRPAPFPPARAAAPSVAAPSLDPPKPRRDLEEVLGGRVLGWVGGVAVVIAAVFFVVMAVHNGWIGETARMALAFAGSAVLVALGVWLYERRGQTQAALATVAAGLAALYASTAAATLHYVVAALGHELRTPTESLRLSSASLLFVNASVAAAGVWWLIDDAGHRTGANAWLFGLAGAHVVLGTLVLRSRASREIGLLLYGVAAALVGVAIAVTLDGPAVVA